MILAALIPYRPTVLRWRDREQWGAAVKHIRTALIFTIAVSALAGSGRARAQDSELQLETITVTAERRPESLQNTAATVTAVSASALQSAAIQDTLSLPTVVPGLTISDVGGWSAPFIRGVGTSAVGPGVEPSVATYVDGVYIPNQAGSIYSFNNISQVEVDKGPQGTLFGRNATGGVIQITTRDPSATPALDAEAGYANYDTYEGNLYGNVGVTSALATNLAVHYQDQQQGWGRYILTGQDAFTSNDVGLRNKWLWTPATGTKLTLSLDFERIKTGEGVTYYTLPGFTSVTGQTFLGPYTVPGRYSYAEPKQYGGSLTFEQDLGWASLTSISADRHLKYYAPFDYGATSIPTVYAIFDVPDSQFSQEIRLASPTGSRVKWIGGLFYFNHNSSFNPISIEESAAPPAPPLTTIDTYAQTNARSEAVFGQATTEVLPKTDLTIGFRYTWDHGSITGHDTIDGSPPFCPHSAVCPASQSFDYSKPTWRLALAHHFTPDILGYVSDNRGFKSGMYNTDSFTAPPVKPEILDAYEVGLKSELFNHRLRLNLAGYYNDWRNIQESEFSGTVEYYVNAAAAKVYGLDFDALGQVAQGLSVRTNISYAHGYFSSFSCAPSYFLVTPNPACLAAVGTTAFNVTGNQTPHTPDFTGTLSIEYARSTSIGKFSVNLTNSYTTTFYWEPDNIVRQPNVDLLNSSLGWASSDGRWDLRLYGRNLLDRLYYVSAESIGLNTEGSPAAPRTYGFMVGLHL